MKIRPMTQEDLPAVLAVVVSGWGKAHAQAAQPDFSEMFGAAAWKPFFNVAEVDGRVVGMAGYGVSWLNYGVYDLFWIGVHTSQRGKGIGKMLVEACLFEMKTLADQVILATDIPEFYEKNFGFTVMGGMSTTQGPEDVLMILQMDKWVY